MSAADEAARRATAVEVAAVVVLTALGAALRFHRLGEWSLWLDEILVLTQNIQHNTFLRLLMEPLLAGSGRVPEATARLVPCLAGVANIPVLYLASRRPFGPRVALVATALLAISSWHVEWSQNVRPYTLVALLATVAALAFYRALEDDSRGWVIAAVAATFATLAAHYTAALLLPVLVAYVVLVPLLGLDRPAGLTRRNLALFFAPFFLVSLPMLVHVRNFFAWYVENRGFFEPARSLAPVLHLDRDLGGLHVALVALAGVGIATARRPRLGLFLGLFAFLPVLLASVLSTFMPVFSQHVILALPGLMIASAVPVAALWEERPVAARWAAAALLAVVAVSFVRADFYYFEVDHGRRRRWDEAVERALAERGPADRLLTQSRVATEYYAPDLDRALIVPIRQLRREPPPAASGLEADAGSASWVLVTDYYLRDRGAFREWVLAECRLVEDFHRQSARFRDGYYRSRQQAVNLWRCPPTEVVREEVGGDGDEE